MYSNNSCSKISTKIRTRRLKLAGHCVRHPEEVASNLVLWVPDKGSRGRGRPTDTFIDTLTRDTGLQLEEMHACMHDKRHFARKTTTKLNELASRQIDRQSAKQALFQEEPFLP